MNNQTWEPWLPINATPAGIKSIKDKDPYFTLVSGTRHGFLRVNIDMLNGMTLHRVRIDKQGKASLWVEGKTAEEITYAIRDIVFLAKHCETGTNDDEERSRERRAS